MGHTARVNDRTPDPAASRQERKQRTRRALLDAALELLEEQGFSSISLRQVTRTAGVVPTAFYRHFADMEELGLALIDESFRTLRAMLREARTGGSMDGRAIHNSVEILVGYVHEHRNHFRFIVRERFGGVASLRQAIGGEIRMFGSDLASDLARVPALDRWRGEDLRLLAGLIVSLMVQTTEEILEAPPSDLAGYEETMSRARRQLRMITLGLGEWRVAGRADATTAGSRG
jgi:AcrR family transcriptional regulator